MAWNSWESARVPVTDPRERLIQFKTNIDVVMSVLDRNGLGDWLADRLVAIGDTVKDDCQAATSILKTIRSWTTGCASPIFPSSRRTVTVNESHLGRGEDRSRSRSSASPARWPARAAAISEIIKWMNYVTDNRFITLAADLSESINVEHGSLWGHYDPETNPLGTRIKAAIQEAGNVSTAIGLVEPERQRRSRKVRRRLGAERHLWRVHAADVHARRASGASRIRTASSAWACCTFWRDIPGPETAADGRTHFGIFATQVWKLFPRGQTIHLNFWDYNDVAAGYFAAAEIAARDPKVGIISIEVARPDFPVADRSQVRRYRSESRREGLLCHSRFRARQAEARLRRRAGLQFHRESGEHPAAPGASRRQRQGDRGHQRGICSIASPRLIAIPCCLRKPATISWWSAPGRAASGPCAMLAR